MKKKVLLKTDCLMATEDMKELAKEDMPIINKKWNEETISFRYGCYLRTVCKDGILKISVFFAEHLQLSADLPAYDLYFDKEKEDFISYNYFQRKWTEAMLDKLDWPSYALSSGTYIEKEERECVCQYFQTEGEPSEPFEILLEFQRQVRKSQLLKRDKKVTDAWKKQMEQVPALPRDWERWVRKVGVTQNFIFYQAGRKKKMQGYCSRCEKMVPIKKPKHNEHGKCSCCRHEIQYKSTGRMANILYTSDIAYLLQRCKDGFVVREFVLEKMHQKGSYQKPVIRWWERRRILYNRDFHGTEYYRGYYKGRVDTWIEGELKEGAGFGYRQWVCYERGKVYGKTLPSLRRKELSRTGFCEFAGRTKFVSPVEYFYAYRKAPYIEQWAKAGLFRLIQEFLDSPGDFTTQEANSLGKSLGIDRFRLGRLRNLRGGNIFLQWLRHEKGKNIVIPDKIIAWYERQELLPEKIAFIWDRMSEVQIKNYLEKQMRIYNMGASSLLSFWQDYLAMAERAQMDVYDSIIYKTKYLVKRHDEMVQRNGDKNLALTAHEIAQKYPHVDERCQQAKEKYELACEDYTVMCPQSIEDILVEGRRLFHCMDKSDTYFSRIESRETYILFLRKTGEEEKPYYTLEVEPDGTVRQKRTFFNRQQPDIEQATVFLKHWQKTVQKRLGKDDYRQAVESRRLRQEELRELREKQVRVNGNFNGKLLADILEEDLLEAETITGKAA